MNQQQEQLLNKLREQYATDDNFSVEQLESETEKILAGEYEFASERQTQSLYEFPITSLGLPQGFEVKREPLAGGTYEPRKIILRDKWLGVARCIDESDPNIMDNVYEMVDFRKKAQEYARQELGDDDR